MSWQDDALAEARRLDAADPLAGLRDRFDLPAGVTYLDGNSLGPRPKAAAAAMRDAVERQWSDRLIRGWTECGWLDCPSRVGDAIASLLGASAGEVLVCDSVTVNLFKLLTGVLRDRPPGPILTEAGNFPTDLHVAGGVADVTGRAVQAADRGELLDRIGEHAGVLLLTHVHYRTGERFDMAAVNAAAAKAGVPVIWDLSHSVGAVPLDLRAAGTEYAVGCGYKYLNGGPGAPAFVYAAADRHDGLRPALRGWLGDADPFAFRDEHRPADGVRRFLVGTPPVLSMLALEQGVATFEGVSMDDVWAKSVALFDFLDGLMSTRCPAFTRITPAAPACRGSHVSYAHPNAWPINNALIARGVIGDFRTPDVLRLGLSPLYTRFEDAAVAVAGLADVMATGEWRAEEFRRPKDVT